MDSGQIHRSRSKYNKRLHLSLEKLEARYPARIGELERHIHDQGRSSLDEDSQLLWYAGQLITHLHHTLQEQQRDGTVELLARRCDELEGRLLQKASELDALYELLGAAGLPHGSHTTAGVGRFLADHFAGLAHATGEGSEPHAQPSNLGHGHIPGPIVSSAPESE